jgi:hypothetical protein
MGPTALLHEEVMKVPAPATGTPTVQTEGSRFTHRNIPRAQKLQCRKRNRIRQELQNAKTRVMLPSHIYTTCCGSFFTWIRAHVTTPRYCRANIPIYIRLLYHVAGPSARAVYGVGLPSLACWDCGFDSHRGHGCLSVVSVVRYQVEISAKDLSLVQRSPTDCGASLCVIKKPRKTRRLEPATGLWKYTHNGL